MALGGSSTSSHAALCVVNISESTLQQDWLLNSALMYLQKISYQVSVKIEKKNHILSMKIGGGNDMQGLSSTLTQRNSILRSLFGIALHGAMDHQFRNEIALCWNGGHTSTQASAHGTSVISSIQSAAMLHVMSMASNLRSHAGSLEVLDSILAELNNTLEHSSFLLPFAATATIADIDICVALLSLKQKAFVDFPVNVRRWMIQVMFVMDQLANVTNVPLSSVLQESKEDIQAFLSAKAVVPPLFFDGTEDVKTVLTELYSPMSGGASNSIKGSKRKEGVKETVSSSPDEAVKNSEQQQGGGKAKLTKQEKKAAAKADGGSKEKKPDAAVVAEAPIDVMALDIRVGKIMKIWPHESADKLYCEEIDLGNGEIRQIASGLRPFYTDVHDLQDKMVLVLCNLKKRTLVGFPSHGMVLCASNSDHTSVELVVPPLDAVIGERILFDGLDANREPEPESKVAKKKIFEGIAPDLRTDADGYVMWKTHRALASGGPVRAVKRMPNASVS